MYIVTGGAGFIGSAIVWKLNQENISDILIVDNIGNTSKWKNLVGLNYLDYIHKDQFLQRITSSNYFGEVEAVIHLGACSNTKQRDVDYLLNNNFHYSCDVCEWSKCNNAYFINASSASVYGDGHLGFGEDVELLKLKPLNAYAYSKWLFDKWLMRHKYDSQFASLRFFNVYGPNEYHKFHAHDNMISMIYQSYMQLQHSNIVELFKSNDKNIPDGAQQRDFIYIKDVVNIIYWMLENSTSGIFNIGTGCARTWNDLVTIVMNETSLIPEEFGTIKYINMPSNLVGKYQNLTQADITKLRQIGYNYPFYSLEEGIADYIQNYLKRDCQTLSGNIE